jgi:hypothetical protein
MSAVGEIATSSVPRPELRILVAHDVPRGRSRGMNRMMETIHNEVAKRGDKVEYFCEDDLPRSIKGRAKRFIFPLLPIAVQGFRPKPAARLT